MKKKAILTLVKDILLIAILGGFMALLCSVETSLSYGGLVFVWLAITGLPFGWRWASKIITAVSLKGIAIKALIAALLGCVAIFAVPIADVIRCLTASSQTAC